MSFVCPVDGTTLVPHERSGIEIDHCPSCRGVWLDRGELDKIIERSAAQPAPQYRDERPRYDEHRGQPPKRRKSFLEDLFD
ncbi:zf-TFIIB domain-containing protein [Sphingomonas sp. MMS12-HWE2-04]|uniref:TFIIB-type zinc ribbon-containing protein n=1 Tax=Sphingomonas sp. MMS12-HWE2-04 TaxID=3234199 RepID=UPI00384D3E43